MCSGVFAMQSSGLSSAMQIASVLWAVVHCGDDQWPVRVVCITFWLSPITLSLTFRLHHIAVRIHPDFSHFVWNIHAVAFLPPMNWYFLHIAQKPKRLMLPLAKKFQRLPCHSCSKCFQSVLPSVWFCSPNYQSHQKIKSKARLHYLGKPSFKKKRIFMKTFHKMVTPPPHCFYEILILIFLAFLGA